MCMLFVCSKVLLFSTELQPDLLELLKPYQETCGNLSQLLESPVGQTACSLLEVIILCV